jgi:hypothetical protein
MLKVVRAGYMFRTRSEAIFRPFVVQQLIKLTYEMLACCEIPWPEDGLKLRPKHVASPDHPYHNILLCLTESVYYCRRNKHNRMQNTKITVEAQGMSNLCVPPVSDCLHLC